MNGKSNSKRTFGETGSKRKAEENQLFKETSAAADGDELAYRGEFNDDEFDDVIEDNEQDIQEIRSQNDNDSDNRIEGDDLEDHIEE